MVVLSQWAGESYESHGGRSSLSGVGYISGWGPVRCASKLVEVAGGRPLMRGSRGQKYGGRLRTLKNLCTGT